MTLEMTKGDAAVHDWGDSADLGLDRDTDVDGPFGLGGAADDPARPTPWVRPSARGERVPARSLARAAFWPALVAVPGAMALALRSVGKSRVVTALASLGAALGLGAIRWQLGRLFREEARYVVERRIGDIEIRHYPPQMIVETTVTHRTFAESMREGLGRVYRWAFTERVPMLAPLSATCDGGGITVAMPLPWRLDLVPDPSDARVVVREIPSRRVAVLRYRGTHDDARAHAMQKRLCARLARADVTVRGDPFLAAYDAPSTLPLLRRVEACVEIV